MTIVNLVWDIKGLKKAIKNNDIIIIVDILRFSSTTITAINNDAIIIPCYGILQAKKLAKKFNAIISIFSKYSLSPISFLRVEKGSKIVLLSPNGAKYSSLASKAKYAFIGAFLNAKTIAKYTCNLSKQLRKNITILAAGEKDLIKKIKRTEFERVFVNNKNKSYFCLEDLLGAGAIISEMSVEKTPDALYAQNAFEKYKDRLLLVVKSTISGKYLINSGRDADIVFCTKLNKYKTIPQIIGGKIINKSF